MSEKAPFQGEFERIFVTLVKKEFDTDTTYVRIMV
jgi:hypothetical protein